MLLLTQDQRARLIANGKSRGDHAPVVKFFNPVGSATWLFSELDKGGDILFGLCDLDFGRPEMGSASLSEIAAVKLSFSLTIERDLCFEGHFPLTIYADAARVAGSPRTRRGLRPPPPAPAGNRPTRGISSASACRQICYGLSMMGHDRMCRQ